MRPEPGVDHPSPSSADFKERVKCTSTPLLGLNKFTFTFMPRDLTLLAQHFYTRMYLFVLVCPQGKQRFLSLRSLTKIFIIDIWCVFCDVRPQLFQYIFNKTQLYTFYLYLETALHVSGGPSTHHQERMQLHLQHLVFVRPLLLPAAIAAGSSNGLTNTRCCRCSCMRSWWWVEVSPETPRAVSRCK